MGNITHPCYLRELLHSHYLTFNYISAHSVLCAERFGLVIPAFKRFSMNIMDHVERLSPHFGFAAGFSIFLSCWEPMVQKKGRKRNAHSLKSTDFPSCFLASHKESPLEKQLTIIQQMTAVQLTTSSLSCVHPLHILRDHFLSQHARYRSLNIYLENVCRVKPWLSLCVKYSPFLNN